MNDVACALEKIKCAYQIAFEELEKSPQRSGAIRAKLLHETSEPFKQLHSTQRLVFLTECTRAFARVFPDKVPRKDVIERAANEGKLTLERIVPSERMPLRSHLGIVLRNALFKTADYACVRLAA